MDERWTKDYVLSVHRSMPNVKKTPRKPMKCLKCAREVNDVKEYAYHVKVCQLSAMGCKECLVTFSAKKYYLQHIKRVHMVPKKHETGDVESEWDTEPDVSIGAVFAQLPTEAVRFQLSTDAHHNSIVRDYFAGVLG